MQKINVYGAIGIDITAAQVVAQLEAAGDVRIHINSEGGLVDDAVAIYNRIKARKAKTECVIDGLAASAATIVAMACDAIIMPDNAMMMIHNAWGKMAGDAVELRRASDMLEKTTAAMVQIYAERTGQAIEAVIDMLSAETWLTAAQALELGFCDYVTGSSRQVEEHKAVAMARIERMPGRLAAAIDDEPDEPDEGANTEPDEADMTDEEKESLQAQIAQLEDEVARLTALLEANREEVDEQAAAADGAEALAAAAQARVEQLEDELTYRDLQAAGAPADQHEALAKLKRVDEALFSSTVAMFAKLGSDEQPRIGQPGHPALGGDVSPVEILAEARAQGVDHTKGLAEWLGAHYPEQRREVAALARQQFLAR